MSAEIEWHDQQATANELCEMGMVLPCLCHLLCVTNTFIPYLVCDRLKFIYSKLIIKFKVRFNY